MTKLKDAEQVRASFGAPADQGASADGGFEEFHTRRKISEPTVAGVNFILGAETLGLYELWSFPVTVVKTTWTTVFGQTLRFEYGLDGKVKDVLINGTSLDHRAGLP